MLTREPQVRKEGGTVSWAEEASHYSTTLSLRLKVVHSMKPAVRHHQRLRVGLYHMRASV